MGIRVELEQDSSKWHEFRKRRLGCSDLPAIFNESPWQTANGLWRIKTGRDEPIPTNANMQRGKDYEPIARKMMEEKLFMSFPPVVFQHENMPYFMASLDGFNAEKNILLEIKAPQRKVHNALQELGMPKNYFWQVQGQLLISGAAKAHFVTIIEKQSLPYKEYEINYVSVIPSLEAHKKIEEAVREFWSHIENDTEPAKTKEDVDVRLDEDFRLAVVDYIQCARVEKNATIAKEEAGKKLKSLIRADKTRGFGVSITRYSAMGRIDYRKIPELQNVDLDKYRGEAEERILINVEEK